MINIKVVTFPDHATYSVNVIDVNDNLIQHPIEYNGWYKLRIYNATAKVEISDIQINGCSIEHVIYTGFAIDASGDYLQPCTAIWNS